MQVPIILAHHKQELSEKIFYKSTNQKQELHISAMFVNGSGRNEQFSQRTLHRWFLPSFGSFGKVVSEQKIFQKSTNQKQESPVAAIFVIESGQNEQSLQRTFHRCFLSSFGSFGQEVSEEKIFFLEIDQPEKRIAYGGHVC